MEFFVFSLVDVNERRSYPVASKQTVRSEAEKEAIKARKNKRGKKPKTGQGKPKGRKKGSLNKDKNQLELSPELLRINELLIRTLKLLRDFVKLKYLALNGHFGRASSSFDGTYKRVILDFKTEKRLGIVRSVRRRIRRKRTKKGIWKAVRLRKSAAKVLEKEQAGRRNNHELLSRDISASKFWDETQCCHN